DTVRLERTVAVGLDLVAGPEVDDRHDADLVDEVTHVAGAQARERVAPEHPTATQATTGGRVATEVPEVGGAVELDEGGGIRGDRGIFARRRKRPCGTLPREIDAPDEEWPMPGKVPPKNDAKKPGKSLKEKRADKAAKKGKRTY